MVSHNPAQAAGTGWPPAPAAEGWGAATALAAPDTPLQKLALWLVLIDIYFVFSRFPEVLALLLGLNIRLLLIVHLLAFLAVLATGNMLRPLRSSMGIWLTLFTVWMGLCAPFSFWKMGTLRIFLLTWLVAYTGFLIVAGLPHAMRPIRLISGVFILSAATVVLQGVVFGTIYEERFSTAAGSLGNPNDFCTILLCSVPFCLLPWLSRESSKLLKITSLVTLAASLVMVARTGSRSGALAALLMLFVLFLIASAKTKIAVVGLLILVAPLAVITLPEAVLERYRATFKSASTAVTMGELSAIESQEGRALVFWESVKFTLENPLFGVGPGVFTAAAAEDAMRRGERPRWKASHNTYTQVSSEMGVPGFLFYAGMLISTVLGALRVFRAGGRVARLAKLRPFSLCLLLSLLAFCVNATFSSSAYLPYLPYLAAVVAILLGVATVREPQPVAPQPLAPTLEPAKEPALPAGSTSWSEARRRVWQRPLAGRRPRQSQSHNDST